MNIRDSKKVCANKKTISVIVISSLFISLITGCAGGPQQPVRQPRMEAALADLREAREQLEKAAPNKGGHRVKAIELIDRAAEQVNEGIEAGERYK